ncbi:MAG: type II secretory pathway predicted ATPase ExeA [Candidatus Krumholzibacteriia bacterium]|jgi:type II secretory pathway predicted ATPase ExeA
MYLDHYGLAVNPFGLSPKLDFLYKSSAFEESMAHLLYGLENSEAIVLITGPIGSGKTMAIQSFMSNLGPRYSFALVTNTQVTSIELLKLVLEDLGVRFPMGVDKSDLLILFKEFLFLASSEGRRVLVVIDEAQNLPRDVLEEVRLLTNLGQGENQSVQVILLGQPELEAVLEREDLAQLRQRIRVHYRLAPLSLNELEEYLNHRVLVAGCDRKIFSKEATEKIYQVSGGVPRVVNTLAGDALLSAFVEGRQKVWDVDVESSLVKQDDISIAPVNPVASVVPLSPAVPEAPSAPIAPAAPVAPELLPKEEAVPVSTPLEVIPQNFATSPLSPEAVHARVDERRPPRKNSHVGRWVGFLVLVGLASVFAWGNRSELGTFIQSVTASLRDAEVEESASQSGNGFRSAANVESDFSETPMSTGSTNGIEQSISSDNGEVKLPNSSFEGAPSEHSSVLAGEFFIHVSSFRSPDRSENLVNKLGESGIDSFSNPHSVRGSTWHRVYVGPYDSRDSALRATEDLSGYTNGSYYKIVKIDPDSGH